MLLYNLTFPNKDICGESELYLRGGELREDGVYIKSGERVSFDTYFNCFSHIKYKKYTRVTDVVLRLKLDGKGTVSVCRYAGAQTCAKDAQALAEKEQETAHITQVLTQKEFGGESESGDCEISVDICNLEDGGFLYFTIEASEDCLLRSGGWHCDLQADTVRIGAVICTYKREEYVRRNLGNLTAYIHDLRDREQERFFDVFVVDNGKTLTDDFGDGISIIPNDNTGGSGGFTRGMKEVCEVHKGEYTHFLLMDDDITFDAQLLWRTYTMLGVLKEEYKNASIGGAMLTLNEPYVQFEMGADWNGIRLKSHRKRVDVRDAREIALNEEDCEADYNGWFYMCMPVSATEKYGYPLQLFIKYDDMEYGLRAAEHIIASSGIAVWHEDFEVKYVPYLDYYINRNGPILSCCFPKGKGAMYNWLKLVLRVWRALTSQRYYALDLIYKGYDDFFKGPEYVYGLDCEEKLAEIRSLCPKFLTEEELKQAYGITVDRSRIDGEKKKMRGLKLKHLITLGGYLIPKCFYRKGIAQVDMVDYTYDGFYKKRKVLQFNPVTGKGFVTEIKKLPMLKAGFKLLKYFFKMAICYRSVAKKYRAAQNG